MFTVTCFNDVVSNKCIHSFIHSFKITKYSQFVSIDSCKNKFEGISWLTTTSGSPVSSDSLTYPTLSPTAPLLPALVCMLWELQHFVWYTLKLLLTTFLACLNTKTIQATFMWTIYLGKCCIIRRPISWLINLALFHYKNIKANFKIA